MDFLTSLLILIGRVLISSLFIWGGIEKLKNWHKCSEKMHAKGVPQIAIVFPAGIALQLIGGLLVLLGFYSRLGAVLLLIFAIPTVYWMHRFWDIKEVEMHKIEKAFFMKSLAVMGGLFMILAVGSGRFGF